MSGTRNRTSKKIPALAAIALMTALTGSVLPPERAAAAPAGQERPGSGRETKAPQNGTKPRREAAGSQAAPASGEAADLPSAMPLRSGASASGNAASAASAFAKLAAANDVPRMWAYIDSRAEASSPAAVTVWLRRLEAVQTKRLIALDEQLSAENVQQALMRTDQFDSKDGSWLRSVRTGVPKADALLKEMAAQGYVLDTAEGYYFPKIDYERYRKYASEVSARYAAYLTIRADETRSELTKDAGLIVSWAELLERAERQSLYLHNYPNSPEDEVVMRMYRQSLYIALYGTDNVPLFDHENQRIEPDAKKAYERQVRKSGQSPFARSLRGYMRVLADGGGKLTPAADAYREAQDPWGEAWKE
ncbi:hypothetical protein [Saccharibacillus deserti]|uniref:hypothetical protein n=1 Tax=Saccharibacillus deserti TaxID=1634444 RepID=UPI0015539E8D|nr:hypothetical protein [Saccharibacillus deserti]